MPQHVRVTVLSAKFCIKMECRHCLSCDVGGKTEIVDCSRRDCDNHKRGAAPSFMPAADTPPFELPLPGSTETLE